MLVFGCLNMKLSKVVFFGAASEVVIVLFLIAIQRGFASATKNMAIWYLIFTDIYPKQTINKDRLFIFIPVIL